MTRTLRFLALFGSALWAPVAFVAAADWPTWRCDARRSGVSSEVLPEQLYLHWVRALPPAMPAWPNESRLHFDASYEPVAAGQTLLVGSPGDGSVTAYDTRTGAERWRFTTEGPVRFAPVVWSGKVYAGSDDGWLYCLDAARGKLLWKLRGAPDDRPDRRQLGNARLISFWPVRGGPVVADGTLYFAAGIWPSMGVFVVAADAETGKLVWRNGDLGLIEKVRLDHNALAESGLSPQGYLLVAGDKLLVPNGRSMPAGLDRKTGNLLYYVQGYRNGDCRVTAGERYAMVGDAGVVDIRSGREVGSRWAAAGDEAPDRFDSRKFHLFEGPIHPYKMFPGCSFRSVLEGNLAFGLGKGVFYAYDLSRATVSEYELQHSGNALKPWRWDAPALWKLATDQAGKGAAGGVVIKASNRVYGHSGKDLIGVELPAAEDGQPTVAWTMPFDETPGSMLAADGRLFVVTSGGDIHCFGPEEVEPAVHEVPAVERPPADEKWARAAKEVLSQTGVTEGYCLVLGVGTGQLLEQLLGQSELKLIGVDPDPAKVDALRTRLTTADLYGTRAEVFSGDPSQFLFPPYLASLIVSEDAGPLGSVADLPLGRLFDTLRPYGGTLCLSVPEEGHAGFADRVAAAGLEAATVRRAGGFSLLERPGPLPDAASWTHESADPARSFFSRDKRVKPPLGVLWYGDGPDYGFWKRKDYGVGVKPQVVGGRVFALRLSGNTLLAYDAYTGRLLWMIKVDAFTRYAAMEGGLYVAGGDRVLVLDPATGRELASFPISMHQGQTPFVSDIRVSGDVILVALAPEKVRAIEKGLWDSTMLVALDRTSGKTLWRRKAEHRFNNNAIAIGGGLVFAIDSVSPIETEQNLRRGEKAEPLPSTILALDARSGRVKWPQVTMNPYRTYGAGNWLGIRGNDDWLCYSKQSDLLLAGKLRNAYAFRAATGEPVWEATIGGGQPWVLRGETFVHQSGHVFDVRTGKQISTRSILTRAGCNYAVANEHLVFLRDHSVCWIDVEHETKRYLYAIRSGCSNSLVAADGLLNVPNFAVGCVCNYPIQTAFAMVHMPEAVDWADETPAGQVVDPHDFVTRPP